MHSMHQRHPAAPFAGQIRNGGLTLGRLRGRALCRGLLQLFHDRVGYPAPSAQAQRSMGMLKQPGSGSKHGRGRMDAVAWTPVAWTRVPRRVLWRGASGVCCCAAVPW